MLIIRLHVTLMCCAFMLFVYTKHAHAAKSWTAMTYNVLFKAVRNTDTLKTIKREKPDFICLREQTPKFTRQFNRALKKHFPWRAFFPKRGTWGTGIASRYPLSQVKHFALRPHRIPGVSAIATIGKTKLLIVCVHLFPPVGKHKKSDSVLTTITKNRKLRIAQASYLVEKLKRVRLPVLLMGDFNDSRDSAAIRKFLLADFRHACVSSKSRHCGSTYPATKLGIPALFEIDHLLGKRIRFISAKVIKRGNSDHYPVIARFRF